MPKVYILMETVRYDMTESHKTQVMQAHVLSELLDYIKDHCGSGTSLAMADLTALCDKYLAVLGFPYIKCNTTRLREYIEYMIPDIKPVQMNHCLSFVFVDDLSNAVADMKDNISTEVSILHKAANILQ